MFLLSLRDQLICLEVLSREPNQKARNERARFFQMLWVLELWLDPSSMYDKTGHTYMFSCINFSPPLFSFHFLTVVYVKLIGVLL